MESIILSGKKATSCARTVKGQQHKCQQRQLRETGYTPLTDARAIVHRCPSGLDDAPIAGKKNGEPEKGGNRTPRVSVLLRLSLNKNTSLGDKP